MGRFDPRSTPARPQIRPGSTPDATRLDPRWVPKVDRRWPQSNPRSTPDVPSHGLRRILGAPHGLGAMSWVAARWASGASGGEISPGRGARPICGQIWPHVGGQLRLDVHQRWPNSGQHSAEGPRVGATASELRRTPNFADARPNLANLGRRWPTLGQTWPILANFDTISSNCGQLRPNSVIPGRWMGEVGRTWPATYPVPPAPTLAAELLVEVPTRSGASGRDVQIRFRGQGRRRRETEDRPHPRRDRPLSDDFLVDESSGRLWTIPGVDILRSAIPQIHTHTAWVAAILGAILGVAAIPRVAAMPRVAAILRAAAMPWVVALAWSGLPPKFGGRLCAKSVEFGRDWAKLGRHRSDSGQIRTSSPRFRYSGMGK